MRPRITDEAKGKWLGILPAMGVSAERLVNRHGPCPLCDGKTSFRFDNKDDRGTWICTHCGSGSGVDLVMKLHGLDFKAAADEIRKHVGTAPVITKVRVGPDVAEVRREMEKLWKSGLDVAAVIEAGDWWKRRLGYVPALKCVRAVPILKCPQAGMYPAMLAIVQGVDGTAVNLHRTFLAEGGFKADCGEPRRVMALPLPDGCAVRLSAYTDVLGIAEGIETAASATALFGTPCWAALNAGNLMKWEPPAGVRVVVFGDNDSSFAGQAAAFGLAKRLRAKKVEVEVRLPPALDMDWNDVWLASRNERPQASALAA